MNKKLLGNDTRYKENRTGSLVEQKQSKFQVMKPELKTDEMHDLKAHVRKLQEF